jgi:hypothetical protein
VGIDGSEGGGETRLRDIPFFEKKITVLHVLFSRTGGLPPLMWSMEGWVMSGVIRSTRCTGYNDIC